MGEKTITNHLALIKSDKVRAKTIERLQMIEEGVRDLYF